ncbi:MAG: (2Fe-2S)-binding protein, partial [Planctomycetes bacterium]|nr:(2Fe-2S)-binding protein [Planctomycetota bacterium]
MPKLKIDQREVEVAAGATILDAARKLGIDIPTLCHLEGYPPSTSCMVCVVRLSGSTRLVPACATRAEEGMVVESETPDVHDARRTALELLLSDHLGDCLAPCHRICPLGINVPLFLRTVNSGDIEGAARLLRDASPL